MSFTPNPRTVPSIVTDQRDYINTTTQRIKADMKDKIVNWEPEAAPLTVLTKKLDKTRSVSQYQFDFLEKEPLPRQVTVSGAQTSGDTSVEVVAGHGTRLKKYDTLVNRRTREMVYVSSMSTDTATVVRGIGGAAAAMNDGDILDVIAPAYEDGSAKGTFKSTKENRLYNYTQILRTGYGFTGRQQSTGLYGGKDPDTERRAQAIEHRKSIELAMWFGKRHSTTGANSRTLSFMGGIEYFIQSNIWNLAGSGSGVEPTERQFIEFLEVAMALGPNGNIYGSGRKALFLSPRWQTIIEGFGRDKIRYEQGEKTLGLRVGKYECVHGEIMLIRQPLFTKTMPDLAVLLDLDLVSYVHHDDRDTKLVENIQANDVDGYEEEYITDCSIEVAQEGAHAILKGIPV